MSSEQMTVQQTGQVQRTFDFFDKEQFDTMQRVCKLFASSELVPEMYRVSEKNTLEKAMANCMIAIEISQRIGASPLMIMQNMIIIYGRPSWSSKFLVATVNTCGRFNSLQYRFTDLGKVGKVEYVEYEYGQGGRKQAVTKIYDGSGIDNIQCVAFTSPKGAKDVLVSSPIDIRLAIQEGWYTKAGSKWKTMTKQMLMYRAASFWTSAYAPELSMGMKTEDEVRDIVDIPYEDVTDKVAKEKSENANKATLSIQDDEPGKEAAKAEAPQAAKEPIPQVQEAPKADAPKADENKGLTPKMNF